MYSGRRKEVTQGVAHQEKDFDFFPKHQGVLPSSKQRRDVF